MVARFTSAWRLRTDTVLTHEAAKAEAIALSTHLVDVAAGAFDAVCIPTTLILPVGGTGSVERAPRRALLVLLVAELIRIAIKASFAGAALVSGMAGSTLWAATAVAIYAVIARLPADKIARLPSACGRNTEALAALVGAGPFIAEAAWSRAFETLDAGTVRWSVAAKDAFAGFVSAVGVARACFEAVDAVFGRVAVVAGATCFDGCLKLGELPLNVAGKVWDVLEALGHVCKERVAASHLLALGLEETCG